jgi:hypothetical protein
MMPKADWAIQLPFLDSNPTQLNVPKNSPLLRLQLSNHIEAVRGHGVELVLFGKPPGKHR